MVTFGIPPEFRGGVHLFILNRTQSHISLEELTRERRRLIFPLFI